MDFLGDVSSLAVVFSVVLGLLGLVAAMALFARNYIKVPPSTVSVPRIARRWPSSV